MTADHLKDLEEFEAELWKIADNLRANSNLASNEYFMPIMGLLFLRQATNRYYAAVEAIEADKVAGRMPKRPAVAADFARRGALNLPLSARYDEILKTPKDANLGKALVAAMEAIEAVHKPLAGQLPRDYERFENDVLESMMRTFDDDVLRTASGDVFGRICECFLAEFSKQGAHDNGEFYTPPSIVQTIVNVIEPEPPAENQQMRRRLVSLRSRSVFVGVVAFAINAHAGMIELTYTVPLSSAGSWGDAGDQALQLSATGATFAVNSGDTVRVTWMFSSGDSFQLLADPHIGLQGQLLNPSDPSLSWFFVPSWKLLDEHGDVVVTGERQAKETLSGVLVA